MIIRHAFAPFAAIALFAGAVQAAPISLNFLGSYSLQKELDFEGVRVGGLSGLQMESDGGFLALADDRGGAGRTPRFYNLNIGYDLGGVHGVAINSQTTLKRMDGTEFPADAPTVDPEGIRRLPDGRLLISSEGNFDSAAGAPTHQPFVAAFGDDGRMTGELQIPAGYNYLDGAVAGARDNQLFEALATTPGGKVFVGNEGPLIEDGGFATATEGATVRIAELDPNGGAPIAQYAYDLPDQQRGGEAGSAGLVELLAMDETSFIALERAYDRATGRNFVSLAYTRIGAATDILGRTSLDGAAYTPMSRETLLDMDDPFMGVDLDNMEAMSWGKVLENGNLSLIVLADDNFNPRYQNSLFMAFEVVRSPVAAVPLPAGAPLLLAALGGLALLRRRR
ncbi:MAG: esterase-like activity of phytase family protein [Pikeienuella sp.]